MAMQSILVDGKYIFSIVEDPAIDHGHDDISSRGAEDNSSDRVVDGSGMRT